MFNMANLEKKEQKRINAHEKNIENSKERKKGDPCHDFQIFSI